MASANETSSTHPFGDTVPQALEVIDDEAKKIMASLWATLDPALGPSRQKAVLFERDGERTTQLAATFVRKHEHHFPAIIWVDASSFHPFMDASRNISPQQRDQVGLEEDDTEEELSEKILKWLSLQNENWLLVIEKADTWAWELIRDLLPQGDGGRILLLTDVPETIANIVEDWKPDLNIMSGIIYSQVALSVEKSVKNHKCGHLARCV